VLSSIAMTSRKEQSVNLKTVQFDRSSPIWNEVPKIGVEGLIATVEDNDELIKQLIELTEYTKKMKREMTTEV